MLNFFWDGTRTLHEMGFGSDFLALGRGEEDRSRETGAKARRPTNRPQQWALLATLCGLAASILGCDQISQLEEPKGPPNFLVIVVDTLRADRLQFAGYEAGKSPRFDALKAESVWFENAYATSSWTLPSTASLFTSKSVSSHRVSSWGSRLGPEQATVVDVLKEAGYRTGMWTANRVVAGRRGFTARFDHAELVVHPNFAGTAPLTEVAFGSGQALADRALVWLGGIADEEDPAPFFAYLHFMEPHGPYLCAPDASPDCPGRAYALNSKLVDLDWELSSQEEQLLDELYDADVSRMDRALEKLIEGVSAEGFMDNTWIVVVSDHGEMLGKDGMYGHGRTLYEDMVHVPLLLRSPTGSPGVIDTPVSLTDVAPTILDIAGLDIPTEFMGRSLRVAFEGGEVESRPIVSELLQVGALPDPRQKHFVSVRQGDQKFLMGTDGAVQRFDLSSDGDEEHAFEAPRDEFFRLLEAAGFEFDYAGYASPEFSAPTPRMRENLKALGYIR